VRFVTKRISRKSIMKKIEAPTLEQAYARAAEEFECSVTALQVEIIQFPSKGVFGMFKKPAIIVANLPRTAEPAVQTSASAAVSETAAIPEPKPEEPESVQESYPYEEGYDDETEEEYYSELTAQECADEVRVQINELFRDICFDIDEVQVSVYDENTLLIEFTGPDAALMIGKEGYRYKALSYMLFNWINAIYGMQLRLEIAEFLKNQEESISRYLVGVCDIIDHEGRGQTKVLDGVLVQIALKQLRERYPDRYVAIRSTRDGGKFIVINSYHEY